MDVTYRIDKDILYIAVAGRIDATNAAAAEEKIIADTRHVSITVRNTGNMTGTGVLTVYRDDAVGDVLYTESL